ncbi:hypothetical protein HC928_01225 [bacterium]|nr:hypothetical protein [bacterium]
MTANLTPPTASKTEAPTPSLPPTDLPYDDGEPLESNRHRIAMNVLIEAAYQAWGDRDDCFAGGNMFVYYSSRQARNVDFRGPDFFAVLGVEGRKAERKYWAIWDEEGRYPDVIVEFMSPSTAAVDLNEKKDLYAQTFHTREYFVYDPFEPTSLQGWRLANGNYATLSPDERGWLWCDVLQLWLGIWPGEILHETAAWLRFFDREGNLVPLGNELAVTAQQQAAVERQRAEAERQRAEAERQRAEAEQQRAEAATAELAALQVKLRAQGIDPEQL